LSDRTAAFWGCTKHNTAAESPFALGVCVCAVKKFFIPTWLAGLLPRASPASSNDVAAT
jgi:hypothetical protein